MPRRGSARWSRRALASKRMTLHVEATAAPAVGLGEIGLFLYDLATLYELIRLEGARERK